ncbi:hypothetical protein BDZ89DRAFT_1032938 [Hymenopellis radicata]|nr:hypothetical protein BDZ89DRAFT_1032938 [Hymenopellis radicata]
MYAPRAPLDVEMHPDIGGESSARPAKRPRAWHGTDDGYPDAAPHSQMLNVGAPSRSGRSVDVQPHAAKPDKESGALTSGRGSRFILANTQELHDRISQLGDRVRQLEDGLGALQSTVSHETHPLLTPELLRIKNAQPSHVSPESPLNAAHRDESLRSSVDTMTLSPNRPQAQSVDISMEGPNLIPYGALASPPDISIPNDILRLSVGFPFPWTVDVHVRKRIRDCLPPQNEAQELCEQACHNALWQYNLNASDVFLRNLLLHCYSLPIEDVSPRKLALLLMILSIGSHVDLTHPIGQNVLHGEAYHHLARAAICEIPLMEEPDFDELHALVKFLSVFFMVYYHLVFSDNKKAVGYAWNLLGFITKLAQGLGLHRDGSKMKVIPEEDDRRRFIFWEMMNLDCRLSLSLGRPPSISLAHVDCKRPDYHTQGMSISREEILCELPHDSSRELATSNSSDHQWKNGFFVDCLTPVLEAMIAVSPPDYPLMIELDNKVRAYDIPPLLDERIQSSVSTRLLTMQRGFVSTSREIALLQLHRRYFTDAMNNSRDPFRFTTTTYLGASALISTVEALFEKEPQLSGRFLCFWFNAFSAAITLSLFVSRAPASPLATYALTDLDRVRALFNRVAPVLPFCGKALPLLVKVADKSRNLHMQVRKNSQLENGSDSSMGGVGSSQAETGLPPSFVGAHSSICQYAEQIMSTPSISEASSRVYVSHLQTAVSNEAAMWLPGVYEFTSAGIGPEERHTFQAAAPVVPLPFSPMDPRVGKHETVNFDHGAIAVDLTETSYMAWF